LAKIPFLSKLSNSPKTTGAMTETISFRWNERLSGSPLAKKISAASGIERGPVSLPLIEPRLVPRAALIGSARGNDALY